MSARLLEAEASLPAVTANLATMLREASAFDRSAPAVAQRGPGGAFQPTDWGTFVARVGAAGAFFEAQGIGRQERVAVWCGNSAERLVAELGIMASGRTSVPIFPGYPADFVAQLLTFSKVNALVVDTPARLASLPAAVRPLTRA